MSRFITIHPENPQKRQVEQVIRILKEGGLIAYPTDSGYALGCALDSHAAQDQIRLIRQVSKDHHFTVVCSNFAQLGQYVRISNSHFRALKAHTPGPYTFILPATKELPRRMLHPKKQTVGIRIPDHKVCAAILDELGEPMLSSSLIMPGENEVLTEGWIVEDRIGHLLQAVVDAEVTGFEPTSVIDLSTSEVQIQRVGAGDLSAFN